MNFYKPVSNKPNFDEIEKQIIAFWKEKNIFKQSIESRNEAPEFVFYEGPPTANGRPGVHHVLARTFKDLVCRYYTMRGMRVQRQAGWDEHGLPVEIEVQKQHNLKSKVDIEAMGIDTFNKYCAESTQKYINEWEELTERMAYWVDFKTAYRTSDPKYIERVWGILKKLFDAELLYKGYKVVPWACDSGTVVSQAEVALGYKDVIDETAYVKFKLTDLSTKAILNKLGICAAETPNMFMLAWTTTPWTLPSNMALAAGSEIAYAVCRKKDNANEYIILSEKRWKAVLGESEWETVGSLKDYFGKTNKDEGRYHKLFAPDEYGEIILGRHENGQNFVIDDENSGTGIVHIAPAFGEDDFRAYNSYNALAKKSEGKVIPLPDILCAVEPNGNFNDRAPEFLKGQSIFNENKKAASLEFARINKIVNKYLDENGLLLKTEKYEHAYPHNWRTGNPLIYFLRPSWYVATSRLKDKLLAANAQINWYPEHVKEGRFGQWLENNIDWSISRERYWGTPIPIWIGEKTGKVQTIGSFAELFEKTGQTIEDFDPHRPAVDDLTWEEDGETFRRIPEVLDCWFDSGSMPYASEESPRGTADYICEAVDQTRGWFYTLLAVTVALEEAYDKPAAPPYKNVLCLGHILDKDGQKMSKSKGNVVNPWELFSKFGADPVRWYMISAVSAGQPIRFDLDGINEVMRRFILPLWNTYSFYVLYGNLDRVNPNEVSVEAESFEAIDLWILTRLKQARAEVTREYDAYDFSKASALIEKFVDDLSNVWVRANRHRFWNTSSGEGEYDGAAYFTLRECLISTCQMAAPFVPLITETIYQNLKSVDFPESLHLTDWKLVGDFNEKDEKLLSQMKIAQEIINWGRSQRQEAGIKIRQPLAKIVVTAQENNFANLICSELNVKEVVFNASEQKLDTEISKELLAEGLAREFIHSVQGMRKNNGYEISDRIQISVDFSEAAEIKELLLSQKDYIMSEVLALEWNEAASEEAKKVKLNGKIVSISLQKLSTVSATSN